MGCAFLSAHPTVCYFSELLHNPVSTPFATGVPILKFVERPDPMAERSEARTVFGRSNTGIVGSNPTRGMDVCPRFSVLCFPV
jgi:hypothetical protein